MTVKSLALIILDVREADWLIGQACTIAKEMDAHLTVLLGFRPVFFSDVVGPESMIYSSMKHWQINEAEKITARFEAEIRATPVLADVRCFAEPYGAEAFFLAIARTADLVIIGTNNTRTRMPDDRDLTERLIRHVGRPVLVLHPNAPFSGSAKRIMIGWSESRESTRAAHDALALAVPGAQIEIAAIVTDPEDVVPGIDSKASFATALNRLGFSVSIEGRPGASHHRAEALLAAAADFQADLVVAGAFGHSVVRDYVTGTVTRALLSTSQLPLLMAH